MPGDLEAAHPHYAGRLPCAGTEEREREGGGETGRQVRFKSNASYIGIIRFCVTKIKRFGCYLAEPV